MEFAGSIRKTFVPERHVREKEKRYRLAPRTQVREEDFGLLFYTMKGPTLFFLTCGRLLEPGFFAGEMSLAQWGKEHSLSNESSLDLLRSLTQLKDKGVLLEC